MFMDGFCHDYSSLEMQHIWHRVSEKFPNDLTMATGKRKIMFQGKEYDYHGEIDMDGRACGEGTLT